MNKQFTEIGEALGGILRHKNFLFLSSLFMIAGGVGIAMQVLDLKAASAIAISIPDPKVPPPRSARAVRLDGAGFGYVKAEPKPDPGTEVVHVPKGPVKSTLPIRLVGTIVSSDTMESLAMFRENSRSRGKEIISINEEWMQLKLLDVERSRVWIYNRSTRRREYIENLDLLGNYESSVKKTGHHVNKKTGEIVVSRAEINRQTNDDTNKLIDWLGVKTHMERGRIIGFKFAKIKPSKKAFFAKLGFLEGDVIKRIDGKKMNSVEKATELWKALHDGRGKVSFGILRGGRDHEVNIGFIK